LDHLRAELEIRGLFKCARQLPELDKKCYELVRRVVEGCKEGDCFVEPDKVAEEFSLVRVKEGVRATELLLATGVVVEFVALIFLYLKFMDVTKQNEMIITSLKTKVAKLTLKLLDLERELLITKRELTRQLDGIRNTIEALKYVIYLLGK